MQITRLLPPVCAVLVAGAFALPAHAAAEAAPVAVSCSTPALVAAINAANTADGGTLDLAAGCTYLLTAADTPNNGLPLITTPVVVNGHGATLARDAAAPEFRILNVAPTGNLLVQTLTISGGRVTGEDGAGVLVQAGGQFSAATSTFRGNVTNRSGGGIGSAGTTTVITSTFTDNSARHGGGISADADLLLANSRLVANHAVTEGGALNNDTATGTTTISATTFSDNVSESDGGAMDFDGGTVTIDGSNVNNNHVNAFFGFGGAIRNGADLTITGTSVSGNTITNSGGFSFGGGIANGGDLTLRSSTVARNTISGEPAVNNSRGAGIDVRGSGASLHLDRTTVSRNRVTVPGSQAGGVANQGGAVTMVNSSVDHNASVTAPGGLLTDAPVSLTSTAIVANTPTNCQGSPVVPAGCTN